MKESAPILSAHALRKEFDGRAVLEDVTLQVYPGEVVGIFGPSGSGKSTLLRCLALLEAPEGGVITYPTGTRFRGGPHGLLYDLPGSGADVHPINEQVIRSIRSSVGLVFQGMNLWDHLSVRKNLCLGPQIVLRESIAEVDKRATELCERFGLNGVLDKRAWQLSGGQRQRVAIVRALMMKPTVLLLDEITSALDPILVVEVMEVIRSLARTEIAIVLVTHHIEFATTICDRVAFMDDGRIVQSGSVSSLRDSPAAPIVGQFFRVIQQAQ